MKRAEPQIDENGNEVFLIDYLGDGIHFAARGHEECYDIVRKSSHIDDLIEFVADLDGNPQVVLSDACEIIWSLEVTDGKQWWHELLDNET